MTTRELHTTLSHGRPDYLPPRRIYTVLTDKKSGKFGFGSSAPARPEPRYIDVPGPGSYNFTRPESKITSIRGITSGFTTYERRKLPFIQGSKEIAPGIYNPRIPDTKIKMKIGARKRSIIDEYARSSISPGPGAYNVAENQRSLRRLAASKGPAALKNKKEISSGPVKYDGRALYISVA